MPEFSYDGRQIANFVLDYCDAKGRPISNLALQKILYFLNVWTLLSFERPLIRHRFEAWEHGPVLQYVYRDFAEFASSRILKRAYSLNSCGIREPAKYMFPPQLEAMLCEKLEFYSRLSASQLREMSHVKGGPWWKVWHHQGLVRPGMAIDNQEIVNFYSEVRGDINMQ